MPRPTDAAIRDAVFHLMLSRQIPTPSNEAIAERAGVPISEVDALFDGGPEPVFDHMLRPFIDAVDDNLRNVPMSATPSLSEQRDIIDHIVDAAAQSRPQLVSLLGLLLSRFESPGNPQIDHFTYQAGVRLLGADYDPESASMDRVRLMIETLSVVSLSPWHDMNDPSHRQTVVGSLLGILNPPTK